MSTIKKKGTSRGRSWRPDYTPSKESYPTPSLPLAIFEGQAEARYQEESGYFQAPVDIN